MSNIKTTHASLNELIKNFVGDVLVKKTIREALCNEIPEAGEKGREEAIATNKELKKAVIKAISRIVSQLEQNHLCELLTCHNHLHYSSWHGTTTLDFCATNKAPTDEEKVQNFSAFTAIRSSVAHLMFCAFLKYFEVCVDKGTVLDIKDVETHIKSKIIKPRILH